MNDQLPDKTVLLAIIATLIIVFSLIFSSRPSQNQLQPSIQWREIPDTTSETLKI